MPPTRSKPDAEPRDRNPNLTRLVPEARGCLGPYATPEQVADAVRAQGFPEVKIEEVRRNWDEGRPPVR
jgi:hypothetical protein